MKTLICWTYSRALAERYALYQLNDSQTVIPLWTDFTIEFSRDQQWRWLAADPNTQLTEQGLRDCQGAWPQHRQIKIQSPWILETDSDSPWIMTSSAEGLIRVLPSILTFSTLTGTDVNFLVDQRESQHFWAAGRELAWLSGACHRLDLRVIERSRWENLLQQSRFKAYSGSF